jgi:hypothetical protein
MRQGLADSSKLLIQTVTLQTFVQACCVQMALQYDLAASLPLLLLMIQQRTVQH